MREILTRYGRHNIGFLWLFIEPMVFTIGITVLWTVTRTVHGSSIPITAFAVTGYSSVLLWRNMPSRTILSIIPNLSLMYHRNVRPIDVFLSRLILEAAGATTSFIVLSLLFNFVGWMDPPQDILMVLLGWGLLAWFGSALAICLGALSELSEIVDKIWHPIAYLLFPLSGAAFSVDLLPPAGREFLLYFPMVNGVEIVREGYFGSNYTAHYDLGYTAAFCLVLSLCGLAFERHMSAKVTPE
jgi:ABC-2 type transport system permease protein/capsular polysaccharide transport system permease protein